MSGAANNAPPPPPPAVPSLPPASESLDLDAAIATRGLDSSKRLSDTSRPIEHHADADADEDGDESADVVVFDSKSLDRNDARLSTESVASVSFGFRDHLLPLSLSGGGALSSQYGDVEGNVVGRNGDDSGGDQRGDGHAGAGGDGSSRSRHRSARRQYNADPQRRMSLVDGIALTVGLQIGSGIFSSPGVVTFNTGSIGASLLIWLLSGVLAWTGASSFAELGAAIPQNGGAQAYLNYSLGPLASYLFSWTAIVALKPGSGAIIAIIFGEYLARIAFHATGGAEDGAHPHEQGLEGIPQWAIKLTACGIVVLVSALNALSARLGTRLQVTTTVVKLGAMIAVPILALVFAVRGHMPDASREAFASPAALFAGSARAPSAYALALYSGLWAYDGWDQSSYVAGEMKRVSRDLPRVIHVSMSLVVVFFLLTVTSYFLVLPASLVKRTNTVALDFGSAIFGPTGGIAFAVVVAFSCFGALNSQIYTSSRLVYAAGKEGYLPGMFGRVNGRTATPVAATLFQAALVLVFVVFGSGFASLVSFYGVCSYTWYFLTVLGLLVLRIKEPNLDRPYRTWLTTPLLFATTALFLLLMPIASAPLEAGAAFAFMAVGLPMYFATQRQGRETIAQSALWRRVCVCARGGRSAQSGGAGQYDAVRRHRESEDEEDEEEMEMLARNDEGGEGDDAYSKRYSTAVKGKARAYDDDDDDDDGGGGDGDVDEGRRDADGDDGGGASAQHPRR